MDRPICLLRLRFVFVTPKHLRTPADPPAGPVPRRFRASWGDRVKQDFRGVLLTVCLATFYLAVAAYGIGTHRYWLTPIGLLAAAAAVASFFTWLSPNPPRRSWMAWVWVLLALVPVAWYV